MKEFATSGYERVLLADDAAGLRSLCGDGTAVDVDHVLTTLGTDAKLRRALNWYAAQSAHRALATPRTSVPTLHIWSDADAALGEYGARATHRFVTGPYQLVTLHGVSHWIPEEAPRQTAELILDHLRRTSIGR
jgi:pimeloyl-ACP methyl ester carboxylesterase